MKRPHRFVYTYTHSGLLTITDVTVNVGIRRLQRHGLKADGVYGKVDNLHISYDGNRITTVLEDADPVTQNGSIDYPGGKEELVFEYNDWGGLIKDESRGIADISYDRFGNPLRVSFSDGGYTENVYSATGEKLRMTHATSLNGTAVTFHYYTQDYLGNNRAVINGSTGAIEQLTAYYPYGGVIADLGTNQTSGQPYKFGGKELITANGLNEYDFGVRWYYQAVPHFTKPDPMCEKYYWLSPYLYCANNPVNIVDPNGKEVIDSTKEDAEIAVDDMRAMFPDSEFDRFRDLIVQSGKKQNGKSLAPITEEALNDVLVTEQLTNDQQALVDLVVDLINSSDKHVIEYIGNNKSLSRSTSDIMRERLGLPSNMENSTIASIVLSLCGEGATTLIKDESLSIILKDAASHPLGSPSTVGHEVIGHGRTLRLGFSNPEDQHVLSIQIQNLILRNLNYDIQRDGTDHAPLKTYIIQVSQVIFF